MKTALTAILALTALLLAILLYNLFQPATSMFPRTAIAYSDLVQAVDADSVQGVVLQGSVATATFQDGRQTRTYLPDDSGFLPRLLSKGVRISARPADPDDPIVHLALQWFPWLIYLALNLWITNRIGRGLASVADAIRTIPAATNPKAE